ncbi:MAG: cell wall hydrolase [Kiloniellales bacterium]
MTDRIAVTMRSQDLRNRWFALALGLAGTMAWMAAQAAMFPAIATQDLAMVAALEQPPIETSAGPTAGYREALAEFERRSSIAESYRPNGERRDEKVVALAAIPGPIPQPPASAGSDSTSDVQAMLDREIECLALNIYFEARGESKDGRIAVGHVVMNRVADRRFPSSVCEVVQQGGEDALHRCQFSWWCDGRSDRPTDVAAWDASKALARKIYWGLSEDPTGGALWYHADYVKPYWRKVFAQGPTIGHHIFYRETSSQVASTDRL